jgi:hypothetical protein
MAFNNLAKKDDKTELLPIFFLIFLLFKKQSLNSLKMGKCREQGLFFLNLDFLSPLTPIRTYFYTRASCCKYTKRSSRTFSPKNRPHFGKIAVPSNWNTFAKTSRIYWAFASFEKGFFAN